MQALEGKVVLITGAGSGLGAATAGHLAAAGATVLAGDIDLEAAESVAAEIIDNGGRAYASHLDVTDAESVSQVVKGAVGEMSRLDALINNAGIDHTVPLEEMDVDRWDRIVDVNLRGPFLMTKEVFPVMRQEGGGRIVNICSTASKRAWANGSAYHASKWGLLGLSHALHVEGREHNIVVTALVVGGMRTPFLLDRFPDLDTEVLQAPENVAEAIAFVLNQPSGTVIPEMTVIPQMENSWP